MIAVRQISEASDKAWEDVRAMFELLYNHMNETEDGMLMPLAKGGADKWISDTKTIAARFGMVVVAYDADQSVGFGFGSVRLAPEHLGGHKVGSINHFFVSAEARSNGVGKALLNSLESWFKSQQVHSIELEVTYNNSIGQSFWQATGYLNELIQMRKLL